jgi:adenosylcobinamide-phosphate synthase
MGWFYSVSEKFFQKIRRMNCLAGIVTVLAIAIFFSAIPLVVLSFILSGWVHIVVEGFLLYWCLSVRGLSDEAKQISKALEKKELPEARKLLARVVGRDTQGLSVSEISRAVIETIGESFVDGFLSPVFWGLLLGAPGAFFFKAVSTGDSMIGHPEPPYKQFGWFAARLDDVLNWIPARLCVVFLVPASFICRQSPRSLIAAFWKDRLKHKSPNAAHGEAVFAGSLQVRLGGKNRYEGKVYPQAFLNHEGRSCEAKDIPRATSLLWTGAGIVAITLLMLGWLA